MKFFLILIFTIFFVGNVKSNNVTVGISGYQPRVAPSFYYDVLEFYLSWDNSWNNIVYRDGAQTTLKDGAFVFFKYRLPNGTVHPIYPTLHSPVEGTDLAVTNLMNLNGMLITRNSLGNGTISGNFSISFLALPEDVEILAFAVEIVQVPSLLPFYYRLGDGYDGSSESTNAFHHVDNFFSTGSFLQTDVNSFDDGEIEPPNTIRVTDGITEAAIDNPNFPPLYKSFICMKYEISQGIYRDFLNTLTLAQQTSRTANSPTSAIGTGALTVSGANRNFIEIKSPSSNGSPAIYGCDASGNNEYDQANDGESIACNFLSWMDVAAWLDWAGLAPMTEIQYEVASTRITGHYTFDYAWGQSIHNNPLTITNPGMASEVISNASITLGNANYLGSATNGPLRNGIFSTPTSNNRKKSGATFFGIMDMSGNLNEACVTVGNVAGRSFNKELNLAQSNGNGVLAANGNALVSYWPGNVALATTETVANAEVTTAAGTIVRGGSFLDIADKLRKADRSQGQVPATRTATQGGRGVLNLP